MRVDEFDFDLPEELIALRPARPRDASRMLHVASDLEDCQFTDIIHKLRAGDVLVVNNTKVLPAALKGTRVARTPDGADIEVEFNLHKAMPCEHESDVRWRAFARPAKRCKVDDVVHFSEHLSATVTHRDGAEVELAFQFANDADFLALLGEAGAIPLPPYIGRKRELDEQDRIDYQTVFAKNQGSVAAPTAGLHFTPEIFASLKNKGISIVEVTLHVGAGTFLPVAVYDTKDHKMHAEWGQVSKEIADHLNQVKQSGGRIICVGTTSLRLLESAADDEGLIQPFIEETDIFITPGYQFKAVDCLITNFHLPRSTLFMLVSAFSGYDKMKQAYAHAIKNAYRFYSYGDACYLERHD